MTRYSRRGEHQWTKFELQAMIALIVRGAHLEGRSRRSDTAHDSHRNIYANFASRLNEAINGKANFSADIEVQDIVLMLNHLMKTRKNVVGKDGLVERQRIGRLTRPLRLAWERSDGRDFDGSVTEWEAGRKQKVMRRDMIARGLIPREDVAMKDAGYGEIRGDSTSDVLDIDDYNLPSATAPEAYARKSTSHRNLPVTVSDSQDKGSHLDRQLEKSRSAANFMSRTSTGRGKKFQLSSAFIEADDDDDVFAPTAPITPMTPHISIFRPERVLAASTIAKRNDALMSTLSAFAVQSSKIVENGQLGLKSGGDTAGAIEAAKLKRPGRNARTAKITEAVKAKVIEKEKERNDDGGEIITDGLVTEPAVQVDDFPANAAEDFAVHGESYTQQLGAIGDIDLFPAPDESEEE